MKHSLFIASAAALALAGCSKHGGESTANDSAVEVLPGSASDAMIQYDTLRSQPPHAPPTEGPVAHRSTTARASGADAAASEPAAPAAPETAAPAPQD